MLFDFGFQSVVLLTTLPLLALFSQLVKVMAPGYFENGEPSLEAGYDCCLYIFIMSSISINAIHLFFLIRFAIYRCKFVTFNFLSVFLFICNYILIIVFLHYIVLIISLLESFVLFIR